LFLKPTKILWIVYLVFSVVTQYLVVSDAISHTTLLDSSRGTTPTAMVRSLHVVTECTFTCPESRRYMLKNHLRDSHQIPITAPAEKSEVLPMTPLRSPEKSHLTQLNIGLLLKKLNKQFTKLLLV
jgi:hypothetical protein